MSYHASNLTLIALGAAVWVGIPPVCAFACSSGSAIARSEVFGFASWICIILIAVKAYWENKSSNVSRRLLYGIVVLAIIDPGYWLSARHGDYGLGRVVAAFFFLQIAAISLINGTRKSHRRSASKNNFYILGSFIAIGFLVFVSNKSVDDDTNSVFRDEAYLEMSGPISRGLSSFEQDIGEYPTTSEGIGALIKKPANRENWNGPYLQPIQVADPWGTDLQYLATGKLFTLISAGPDKVFDTRDDVFFPDREKSGE